MRVYQLIVKKLDDSYNRSATKPQNRQCTDRRTDDRDVNETRHHETDWPRPEGIYSI